MTGANNSFFWLILFILIFYFMLIRPQQKQRKQREQMLDSLEVGNRIITVGGIHGTIVALQGEKLILEIADNTQITLQRSGIGLIQAEKNEVEE